MTRSLDATSLDVQIKDTLLDSTVSFSHLSHRSRDGFGSIVNSVMAVYVDRVSRSPVSLTLDYANFTNFKAKEGVFRMTTSSQTSPIDGPYLNATALQPTWNMRAFGTESDIAAPAPLQIITSCQKNYALTIERGCGKFA
jgi:hypothetical protein